MICDNLAAIRQQIEQAAIQCGRSADAIRLLAVSKRMPLEAVLEAAQCGQLLFGENYLQDALSKIEQADKGLHFHFIGHLQSNKTRQAAEFFQMIETVDRIKIARLLDKHAAHFGKKLDILIQVNVGREAQKSGVLPDKALDLLTQAGQLKNLRVRGLMTMPPYGQDSEASRPWFVRLRQLAEQAAAQHLFFDNKQVELSMGMSGDFMVAIEEGATLIRVGTAIFGTRP